MDIVSASLLLAVIATVGMGLLLFKHIMFKRELLKLKEDMKQHHLQHGFDNDLWVMFTEKTRTMLKFNR
jgi:hypothetical protein